MRYSNGGYIGTGVYPNEYGDVDGIWRYFSDVSRAIKDNNWYVSTIPENINVAPTAVFSTNGESVTLNCTYSEDISGFDEIFLWQKSFNKISWTGIPDSDNQQYSFLSNFQDSGSYLRCKIYRGLKSGNSNIVPLNIASGKITITSQPSNTTVYAGETASFYIVANSTAGPINYQWEQSVNTGVSWASAPGSSTTSAYSFVANYASSGYRYRCYLTADGAFSVYSNTGILTVHDNYITFTLQPFNKTCGLYSTLNTFNVTATTRNNQTPAYQWYRADNSPSFNNWREITASDTLFTGRNTNQLTVSCSVPTTHLKCLATYSNISGFSNTAIHSPYSP